MIKSFVTTIGVIYAILFTIMCHAVLMACRQAIRDPSSLKDELKPIANNIPHGCPEFPVFIFSISDFILENHPKVAEELLRYAANGLQGISCMFDMVLFSAYLLTYAENIAFFFYLIYLPYLLMRKGIELALKIAFVASIIFVLVELKWLVQDHVFDRQDLDTFMEKGVYIGKRVIA